MVPILTFINKLISKGTTLCCILLLLISGYTVYDNLYVYNNAIENKMIAFKPEKEVVKIEKKITDKQVAWLTVEGTGVDFPIMQGDDNFEFLNTDPYGEFSMGGSIYLDCHNKKDFSDGYNLLYGHHMSGGAMFGCLDRFADEKYFNEHKEGVLITEEGRFEYNLFAVAYADALDTELFSLTRTTRSKALSKLKECSLIYTEDPAAELSLLAMSTCAGEKETSRLMVFGTLTPVLGG